jgi:hypothetical protein
MRILILIALSMLTAAAQAPAPGLHPNVLPAEVLRVLQTPSKAIFYSLEPWERPKAGDKTLQHYKILGQTNLDPKNEQVVAGAFQKAVKDWDGMIAMCFDPRHALRIVSGGHTYDFLLCYNCHQLYVYKDDKELVGLGAAGSPKFLNSLLAAANVPLSQTDTEEQQAAERKKAEDDQNRWLAAMPASIKPLWPGVADQMFPNVFPLRGPLAEEYPDVTKRILKLLEWYGNGAGPWSGYPSYEDAATDLLHDYPTKTILAAIQSSTLSDAQTEGAARFFGSWDFSKRRPGDLALLPDSLKKTLLEHSLKSSDTDKQGRAKHAFQ